MGLEGETQVDSTVMILTGLPEERSAMRSLLAGTTVCRHPAGTRYDVAPLSSPGWQVALGTVGRGNRAAAVMTERAITWFEPVAVLFVGIAGALSPRLHLGDVVVATRVYAIHGGRDGPDGFGVRPESWEADHELLQLAEQVAADGAWLRRIPVGDDQPVTAAVQFGPTCAGDVVLNSATSTLARRIRAAFNDAVAIDTEDAGVVQAAHLYRRTPVLTIRGISDRVEDRKETTDARGWRLAAAERAAAFSGELAVQIAADPVPAATGARGGRQPARSLNGRATALANGAGGTP